MGIGWALFRFIKKNKCLSNAKIARDTAATRFVSYLSQQCMPVPNRRYWRTVKGSFKVTQAQGHSFIHYINVRSKADGTAKSTARTKIKTLRRKLKLKTVSRNRNP